MEDFRIKTSWRRSRKRRRLKKRLGADGVLAIEDIWSFAAEMRWDGALTGLSNEDLAEEAGWDGDANELMSVLVECGLIDGNEGEYSIHDWPEHNPYVASHPDRSEQARAAVNVRWERQRAKKAAEEAARAAEMQGQSDANDTGSNTESYGSYTVSTTSNTPSPFPDPFPDPYPHRSVSAAEVERRVANEWGWDVSLGGEIKRAGGLAPFSEHELAYAKTKTDAECKKPKARLRFFLLVVERYRRDEAKGTTKQSTAPPALSPEAKQVADTLAAMGLGRPTPGELAEVLRVCPDVTAIEAAAREARDRGCVDWHEVVEELNGRAA